MVWAISKVLIASILIAFTSWLGGKKPGLAGFLMALPISSMIALALNYAEFRDDSRVIEFAKSILVAVPLSLTFFVPFFLSSQLKWKFEFLYLAGIVLLTTSYFVHRFVFKN